MQEELQRQLDQHHYFIGQFVIVKKHQTLMPMNKGGSAKTISISQINVNADSEDMLGGIVRWLPGQHADSSNFVVPEDFIVIVRLRISMYMHSCLRIRELVEQQLQLQLRLRMQQI